jgi:hypothetical protein
VSTRAFNKFQGHWLVSDSLIFSISICLKLKKKIEISTSFDNFMGSKFVIALELGFLASNIRK